MKSRRLIAAALMLICMFSFCAFSGGVSAADELTLTRVVAIDDYNLVFEFSDPVALNMNGATIGPWICIRIMDDAGNLIIEKGKPMQIGGSVAFVSDGKDDRMLFIMDLNNDVGATSITELLNFEGDLARFSEYKVLFCIEEIHAKIGATKKDYKVENVTTKDGSVALTATTDVKLDSTYEGCYHEIEVDPDYVLYPPEESSSSSSESVSQSEAVSESQSSSAAQDDNKVASFNPVWYFVIGGVVLIAAIIVVVVLSKKGKKKNR